ncbi:MAG TPA: hypothetical protein VE545_06710, partial [Candidatus Dormibacteraeota bacterium]|nr:hypothetical protein [Candidatus Dormibacteraeota bacterium]
MPQETGVNAKWFLLIAIFTLFAVTGGILFWRSLHIDNFTHDWVVRELSERFETKVELADLHVSAFPEMSVEGHNLVIYHRDKDYPFIQIDQFAFHLGVLGIFSAPHEISSISLNSMAITVPPRGQQKALASAQDTSASPEENKKALSGILVDEIICENTKLVILPKVEGKLPLEWDIHALSLFHAGANR